MNDESPVRGSTLGCRPRRGHVFQVLCRWPIPFALLRETLFQCVFMNCYKGGLGSSSWKFVMAFLAELWAGEGGDLFRTEYPPHHWPFWLRFCFSRTTSLDSITTSSTHPINSINSRPNPSFPTLARTAQSNTFRFHQGRQRHIFASQGSPPSDRRVYG
jgi:hypothetical protein